MRVKDGKLSFQPFLPGKWKSFSFNVGFRETSIKVKVTGDTVSVTHLSGPDMKLMIRNCECDLKNGMTAAVKTTTVRLTPPPLPYSVER
jgi:maltose phosphorylase